MILRNILIATQPVLRMQAFLLILMIKMNVAVCWRTIIIRRDCAPLNLLFCQLYPILFYEKAYARWRISVQGWTHSNHIGRDGYTCTRCWMIILGHQHNVSNIWFNLVKGGTYFNTRTETWKLLGELFTVEICKQW